MIDAEAPETLASLKVENDWLWAKAAALKSENSAYAFRVMNLQQELRRVRTDLDRATHPDEKSG